MRYWNKTDGWYSFGLSLVAWGTEGTKDDQWWKALFQNLLTKFWNGIELSNSSWKLSGRLSYSSAVMPCYSAIVKEYCPGSMLFVGGLFITKAAGGTKTSFMTPNFLAYCAMSLSLFDRTPQELLVFPLFPLRFAHSLETLSKNFSTWYWSSPILICALLRA